MINQMMKVADYESNKVHKNALYVGGSQKHESFQEAGGGENFFDVLYVSLRLTLKVDFL